MSDEAPLFSGPRRRFDRPVDFLRGESVGGVLLMIGAAIGLIWANTPWGDGYQALREAQIGPAAWGLDLDLAQWAADGLLAIFFFVVGVELKREIVSGELRRARTAMVPIAAAAGGMAVPALFYLAFNVGGATHGWAIPTATDIAFAVAVLTLVGKRLPPALRAFLLTLAVVDDLLAILIIAVVYTDTLALLWAAGAVASAIVFAIVLRRGITHWYLTLPLALATWYFLFRSGIHATIAGVGLGMLVPAQPLRGNGAARRPTTLRPGATMADVFEHRFSPISSGFAVPIFALLSAGVAVDAGVLRDALTDPVAQGVALGLVLGKPIGITATTWLVCRLPYAQLSPGLRWADIAAMGVLAGTGFTVSMLISELAFGPGSPHSQHGIMAVLAGSLVAAAVGAIILSYRGRVHDRLRAQESSTQMP